MTDPQNPDRFTCNGCKKTWPKSKAQDFEGMDYCPTCFNILEEDDVDPPDTEFGNTDIDVDESKIRRK